jgi:hypothetical protein
VGSEARAVAATMEAMRQGREVIVQGAFLDERFLVSNHIRRPRRVCRTRYG